MIRFIYIDRLYSNFSAVRFFKNQGMGPSCGNMMNLSCDFQTYVTLKKYMNAGDSVQQVAVL